jgi:hypothetical protein
MLRLNPNPPESGEFIQNTEVTINVFKTVEGVVIELAPQMSANDQQPPKRTRHTVTPQFARLLADILKRQADGGSK